MVRPPTNLESLTLDDLEIDCHCHVFNARVFPVEAFLRMCLRRWARDELGPAARAIAALIKNARTLTGVREGASLLLRDWQREWVGPAGVDLAPSQGSQGGANHVAAFVGSMLVASDEDVKSELLPPDAAERACTPLMMDLDSALREPPPDAEERWQAQLDNCSRLAAEHAGRAFPFFAAHPARPNLLGRVVDALTRRGFYGVKIYPPLGHEPDDVRLHEVYQWCERHRAPVTVHCSPVGVWSDLNAPTGVDPMRHNVALAQPANWRPVCSKFPQLHVNLAHFGGQWEAETLGRDCPWLDQAVQMLHEFPNCFADVSYHCAPLHANPEVRDAYFRRLRQTIDSPIGDKVLWGTDYIILRTRCRHDEFRSAFAPPSGGLGEDQFRRISNHNPRRFLFLDDPPDRYLHFIRALPPETVPGWLKHAAHPSGPSARR